MTEQSEILYSVEGGVATITFNRPDQRNALTAGMIEGYYDLLLRAESDAAVRAVIVTGSGKAFSVGADFTVLKGLWYGEIDNDFLNDSQLERGHPIEFPATLAKPVIAAVNGSAAGLGLIYALYADVRFAAVDTKLTTAFSRLGLVAHLGVSWLLPRMIGVSNALDLLLSARTITAEEGRELGLIQRVVPAGEAYPTAVAYARDLVAHCSPTSMALIKRQVYDDFERGLGEAASRSVALLAESLRRSDMIEGVTAYMEKRLPVFAPYPPAGPPRPPT